MCPQFSTRRGIFFIDPKRLKKNPLTCSTYLCQDCEGLRIQDVNILVLGAHHKAAHSIIFHVVLLQYGHASDHSLREGGRNQ